MEDSPSFKRKITDYCELYKDTTVTNLLGENGKYDYLKIIVELLFSSLFKMKKYGLMKSRKILLITST
jgi:hypothetical protein